MKLEDQVTSLELSKRLKELGVSQNAYWTWYTNSDSAYLIHNEPGFRGFEEKSFDAFTVAELGEMLPKIYASEYHLCFSLLGGIESVGNEILWFCGYRKIISMETENAIYGDYLEVKRRVAHSGDVTEANARAKMLVYLLENKLVK